MMKDTNKTKAKLITELATLRRKVAEMETISADDSRNIEREGVAAALRDSEQKYRTFFENAAEGIVIVQDGQSKLVNDRLVEITGFTMAELTGRPFLEFIHPEDRKMVAQRYERRLRGGDVPRSYDFRTVTRSGDIKWLQVSGSRVNWQGQSATLNFLTDITEQKKAEEQLRRSEQKYAALVENSNDGIVVIQDGLLTFLNPRMTEILGFDREEGSKPFIDFVAPAYRALVRDRYLKRISGLAIPSKYEIELMHKNGQTVPVEVNASIINYEGKVADMAIISDTTERKKMDNALKSSETFNASLLDNAPNPVVVTNTNDTIRYVNPAFETLTGYSSTELIGLKPPYPWWPTTMTRQLARENVTERTKELNRLERRYRKKNGEMFWIVLSIKTVMLKDGTQFHIGNWMDITERKEMEDALRASETFNTGLLDNAPNPLSVTNLDTSIR